MSDAAAPPWAQSGITDVPMARAFLAALRAPDVLVLASSDADRGALSGTRGEHLRGHGLTLAQNVITASPPPEELAAHHRSFGLLPRRLVSPRPSATARSLAERVLADDRLVAALRADRELARIMVSYKDASTARLIDALGLEPIWCDPHPEAYERANDKLALARAGAEHGFETLPAVPIPDAAALAAHFDAMAARHGQGCIVRTVRGTGGRNILHARTLRKAERARRSLATADVPVMLLPYVPPALVLRNVAAHGIVTSEGFVTLALTDQILRRTYFRGGHVATPWSGPELAAVAAGLAGVARWFRAVGYAGAPAGVDGFVIAGHDGPRFVVIDPNARWSATLKPWAAITALIEQAGRPLVWCLEAVRFVGFPPTLARMRRRLGSDLLAPHALARGGILPALLSERRLGPGGVFQLWSIVLGLDAEHVAHLRRRIRSLGIIER